MEENYYSNIKSSINNINTSNNGINLISNKLSTEQNENANNNFSLFKKRDIKDTSISNLSMEQKDDIINNNTNQDPELKCRILDQIVKDSPKLILEVISIMI